MYGNTVPSSRGVPALLNPGPMFTYFGVWMIHGYQKRGERGDTGCSGCNVIIVDNFMVKEFPQACGHVQIVILIAHLKYKWR